jgi:hypothetical protein
MSVPLVDHALAVRLEGAEAAANARFVEARAAVSPAVGATWRMPSPRQALRLARRRRGAQSALLAARRRQAWQAGCDLAMVCARPGSDSHRNAERRGFRVACTRIRRRRD